MVPWLPRMYDHKEATRGETHAIHRLAFAVKSADRRITITYISWNRGKSQVRYLSDQGMLLNTLVVAAVIGLAASAQGCATIPLCCDQLIYGPTAAVTSTANSLGVTSLTYPIGVDCVPIENPPADYILLW